MYKIISEKMVQRLSDGAFVAKGTATLRGNPYYSNAWLNYQKWLETEEGVAALEEFKATNEQ